jgi:hypothetical protein
MPRPKDYLLAMKVVGRWGESTSARGEDIRAFATLTRWASRRAGIRCQESNTCVSADTRIQNTHARQSAARADVFERTSRSPGHASCSDFFRLRCCFRMSLVLALVWQVWDQSTLHSSRTRHWVLVHLGTIQCSRLRRARLWRVVLKRVCGATSLTRLPWSGERLHAS